MGTRLSAGKTQPVATQDTLVRIRAQEALHQHGKSRLLRFFPRLHLQGFIHTGQQRSPFAVGQKPGVTHHLKMARRNVADIAPDHLFLAQHLAFMLPRAVIEIVMNHRATTVVSQAGCRHRRSLQVPAQIFNAVPGSPGLLRKVHLPVPAILGLKITAPLALIADVAKTRQHAGHDAIVAAAQQSDNRTSPDGLHGLLFKEEAAPDAVLNVEAAPGNGDVDVWVLIELTAVSVQGAEYADLNALFTCPLKHGAGGASEQVIEQGPVIVKERPEQVWHGKSDVLPLAVGQDVLLLSNPLLGGLHAAGAAGL